MFSLGRFMPMGDGTHCPHSIPVDTDDRCLYCEIRYLEAELASARRAIAAGVHTCFWMYRDFDACPNVATQRSSDGAPLCDDHAALCVDCTPIENAAAIREADHAERERNGR